MTSRQAYAEIENIVVKIFNSLNECIDLEVNIQRN